MNNERVTFAKPNHTSLSNQGFMAADMHLHTRYSDGHGSLKVILRKAKRLNIGLAITDHNEVKGVIEAMKINGTTIIPAIEAMSKEGPDLLAYFYSKNDLLDYFQKHIEPYKQKNPDSRLKRSYIELIDAAHNYSCVLSGAHPFGFLWKDIYNVICNHQSGERILKELDAFEVINGTTPRKRNVKAITFADDHNKAYTAGSDAHVVGQVGRVLTYNRGTDVDSFLTNIMKHRSYCIGQEATKLLMGVEQTPAMSKHMKYTPSNIKVQIQNKVISRNLKKLAPVTSKISDIAANNSVTLKHQLNKKVKMPAIIVKEKIINSVAKGKRLLKEKRARFR